MPTYIAAERKHTPLGKPIGVVYEEDPRLPHPQFQYPNEIEQLLEDPEMRALLDRFIMDQTMRYLAQTLNRLLTAIEESKTPAHECSITKWAIGINPDGKTVELIAESVGLTARHLYRRREEILKMLKA